LWECKWSLWTPSDKATIFWFINLQSQLLCHKWKKVGFKAMFFSLAFVRSFIRDFSIFLFRIQRLQSKTFKKSPTKFCLKVQLSRKIRLKSFPTLSAWIYFYNMYPPKDFLVFRNLKEQRKEFIWQINYIKRKQNLIIVIGERFWVSDFNIEYKCMYVCLWINLYPNTVKSRAVDRSTIQFWTILSKGHST
jgi:hypothetical protein